MAQTLNVIVCLRTPLFVLAAMFFMVEPICFSAVGEEIPKGNVTWGIGWIGDGRDGALILDVVPKGPADKLGLVPGDVISFVNGRAIKDAADLKEQIKNSRPVTAVNIIIERFGTRIEKTLLPSGVLRLEVKELDRSYRSFPIPGVPKVDLNAPTSAVDALDSINVLHNVFVDRKSGDITLIGIYDPKYPTGSIPYLDLLKTALRYPEPGLSIDPIGPLPADAPEAGRENWTDILGLPLFERERQVLIREMAASYGLTKDEYVTLYNYANLEAKRDFAPADVRAILVKAYRHLGWGDVADAHENLAKGTADDSRQALRFLKKENRLEEFSEGQPLTPNQLLVFSRIMILESLGMPQEEVRELLTMARADQIGPQEISRRMYEYVALWLYDLASARKKAGQGNKTVAVSRPINRIVVPKLGAIPVDPARLTTGEQMYSRIRTTDLDPVSHLARVMYEADYVLKALNVRPDLFENIPGYLTISEYISQKYSGLSSPKFYSYVRFWLEPKRVQIQASAKKDFVAFGVAEMTLKTKTEEVRATSPEDERKVRELFQDWCNHVTDNYELYSQAMPALHTVQEAAKIIALARWLRQNRIEVNLTAVQQERWDAPDRIPAIWNRRFGYLLSSSGDYSNWTFPDIEGGVVFEGSSWTSYGPASRTTETGISVQLAMSNQLGQKAAQAAARGDLETARHYSELSAQALTGQVTRAALARQNVALPTGKPTRASPASVQFHRELLKETGKQISVLRQNPSNAQAAENLRQLNSLYDETQSRPVTPADMTKLRTVLRPVAPPPPLASTSGPVLTDVSLDAFLALQRELQQKGKPMARWIEDQIGDSLESLKAELKDQAIDAILDRMPFSEALKHEISIQIDLMKRYKELFGEMREDSDEFLVGWSKNTKEAASCLASGRTNCAAIETEIERLTSKFADKSSNRWFPWLEGDIEERQ